jgi:hypothetical protein
VALETALKAELLQQLIAYLNGQKSGQEVAEWATNLIDRGGDVGQDELLKWTLGDLMCLGHDDSQWDTPVEDLEYLRDCLLGKEEFKLGPVARKHT